MIGDLACNARALCLAGGGAKPPHRGVGGGGGCAGGRRGVGGGGRRGLIFLFNFPAVLAQCDTKMT